MKVNLFLWIIVLTLAIPYKAFAESGKENPQILLEKIEKTYKNIHSYYDQGTAISSDVVIHFTTRFSSDNEFYLHFREHDLYFNDVYDNWIKQDSKSVTVFSDWFDTPDKIIRTKTLKEGLVKLSPGNMGLIGIVPNQLIDDLGIRRLTRLDNPRIIGRQFIDNQSCIYLTVERDIKDAGKFIFHLWILEDTYLIKKAKRISKLNNITYHYKTIKIEPKPSGPVTAGLESDR